MSGQGISGEATPIEPDENLDDYKEGMNNVSMGLGIADSGGVGAGRRCCGS